MRKNILRDIVRLLNRM